MNNIHELTASTCQKFEDNILFEKDITYKQTYELVLQRAAFIQSLELKKGDVVAILAANSPAWAITHMAIVSSGAIVLPLDTNLTNDNYQKMMDAVGTEHVFVSSEFDYGFTAIESHSIELDNNIENKDKFSSVDIGLSDLATLIYTSGTTGNPKIVSLTHSNIVKTSLASVDYLDVRSSDCVLAILPFYHVYALIANIYAPFVGGSSLVVQPSLKGPDIVQSLKENNITIFPAVPQLWDQFFEGIANKAKAQSKLKYNLLMFAVNNAPTLRKLGLSFFTNFVFKNIHSVFGKDMRFLLNGGASLKEETHKAYINMGFKIVNGYGLTETTGPICGSSPEVMKYGSVGRPLEGNEVEIRNSDPDGIGEVWLRGTCVMPGYYRNEEANSAVFDEDNWFNSGDLGYLDRENDLHITGRLKNVIVLDSGKNVYAEEVEAIFQKSELIKEIAVFGRKKTNNKESVFAAIVPTEVHSRSYQELKREIAQINNDLPMYMRISNFAVSYDPLPRTSTKKVIIREVIGSLESGAYQTSEEQDIISHKEIVPTNPKEEEIIRLLKIRFHRDILHMYQDLNEFDMDSLGRISLLYYLEESLNLDIDTEKFMAINDLSTLVSYLASCSEKTGQSISHDVIHGEIISKLERFYNPLINVLLYAIGFLCKLIWKMKIVNPEKLIVDNSVIIANHQSYLDIVLVLSSLSYSQRKEIYILGKKELSFFRFIFPGLRVIFVDRGGNVFPALKAGADILRQGKSLFLFPEGTRSRDGKVARFKIGAAYLSKNLNKKVVPVSISGAYDIFSRYRLLPQMFGDHIAKLVVGETIDPMDYGSVDSLNSKMHQTIIDNLD